MTLFTDVDDGTFDVLNAGKLRNATDVLAIEGAPKVAESMSLRSFGRSCSWSRALMRLASLGSSRNIAAVARRRLW